MGFEDSKYEVTPNKLPGATGSVRRKPEAAYSSTVPEKLV